MDWSAMFQAEVVVFGCGNLLFGDDGLAPTAVAALAAAPDAPQNAVFVDAGTSIRPLLLDLTLSDATPRRVILVDTVQEPGREPGGIHVETLDDRPGDDPAENFLHLAPTLGLLRRFHRKYGAQVLVVTVQAQRLPELVDDSLSPEALAALPRLVARLCSLCRMDSEALPKPD